MSDQQAHCETVGHAGPTCPSIVTEGYLPVVHEIDSRTPIEPIRLFDCHVHCDALLHKGGLCTWANLLKKPQQSREMSHNSVDYVIYSCKFPRHCKIAEELLREKIHHCMPASPCGIGGSLSRSSETASCLTETPKVRGR